MIEGFLLFAFLDFVGWKRFLVLHNVFLLRRSKVKVKGGVVFDLKLTFQRYHGVVSLLSLE